MHEVSIAENILEIVLKAAEENGMRRITKVALKVGSLTAIMPESLKFAFRAVSNSSLAEDAELAIEMVQAKAQCDACRMIFEIDYFNKLCPNCARFCSNVISGYEFYVNTIEGE